MDVLVMRRRAIALLLFGIILTVNAFCEYEIQIVKPLPAKYLMESYIWLNDEEIIYNIAGHNPSQLRKLNITNGSDELLLDGEERDEDYHIFNLSPVGVDRESIIVGISKGRSSYINSYFFNNRTKNITEIKYNYQNNTDLKNQNNIDLSKRLFEFGVGLTDAGFTYIQKYPENGRVVRYDYSLEEAGIQKVIYNSEFFKVSDVMDDYLLITQIGRSSAINYLTHFDGDGFSRASIIPESDSQRLLRTNWGAYFLKDGNILFGEYMDDDTDYFDPDKAYCRLRICDREGDTLYTFDDFLYMRDGYKYYTMSPDRTKIIIQGYDMNMWPPQTKAYLLVIIYK